MGTAETPPQSIADREAGLHRQLSARQISMIALGGAIGTGLFLGSAVSVRVAGPGVILSYTAGAFIALALMWALAEMTVVHPVAGSFGVFAEVYLHSWAGFVSRYSYWFGQSVAIGSELVAVSIYCRYWAPGVPAWMWIAVFSAGMIFINARTVGNFGTFEYWFALTKVTTIFVFLVLGTALILGMGYRPLGTHNYTAFGGFLPHGWTGVILGVAMAVFSYLGLEVVSVAAGEARHPEVAVPQAMRWTLARLALFYIGGMAVLVGVMPWTQAGLTESPFVRVFQATGIRFAGGLMNFVVLTAALSSVNTDLYLTTRMLFSLSRGGYAPKFLGKLNAAGVPIAALMISCIGMLLALVLDVRFQESAFLYTLGASFFGGLLGWFLIFVTHLSFRRRYEKNGGSVPMRFAPRGPWSSIAGALALIGVLISTWWIPGMRITILAGLPWLAFITLCYFVSKRTIRVRVRPEAISGGRSGTA